MIELLFLALPVPSEKKAEIYNTLTQQLTPNASTHPFPIPNFKTGTLEQIMKGADEMEKNDAVAEGVVSKIVSAWKGLKEPEEVEAIKNEFIVEEKSLSEYLDTFSWNNMKYRTDKSIKETLQVLMAEITAVDNQIKTKTAAYQTVKSSLASVERRQSGNLSVRILNGILKKEEFIQDSEYLKTMIIAVPNQSIPLFLNTYETLTAMVVPRSACKLTADNEYTLFSVVVFTKVAEEFAAQARENKFVPRDFTYDEVAIVQSQKEYTDLQAQQKEQQVSLLRFLKTNFGEIFSAWFHIKALRIFSEAVMRFGLPPDFLSALIQVTNNKVMQPSLQSIYDQVVGNAPSSQPAESTFAQLQRRLKSGKKEDEDEVAKAVLGTMDDDVPWVQFPLRIDWI